MVKSRKTKSFSDRMYSSTAEEGTFRKNMSVNKWDEIMKHQKKPKRFLGTWDKAENQH